MIYWYPYFWKITRKQAIPTFWILPGRCPFPNHSPLRGARFHHVKLHEYATWQHRNGGYKVGRLSGTGFRTKFCTKQTLSLSLSIPMRSKQTIVSDYLYTIYIYISVCVCACALYIY